MIFRNINIYQMPEIPDEVMLASYLDSHRFTPCLPSHARSVGFTKILGTESRTLKAGDVYLFCLLSEEKVMPPASVKTQLNRATQAEERRLNRSLTRNEKAELKEQIESEMLPKAFTKITETWAYIDTQSKMLVIDTSSQKRADGVARTIKGSLEGGILFPMRPKSDVGMTMGSWLVDRKAPAPFTFGEKCELYSGEGVIKYRSRCLDDEKLRQYLTDDLRLKLLSLENDRCQFVITEDFLIKEFSLKDDVLKTLDVGRGEPWEVLSGSVSLMAKEVRVLVKELLDSFGGNKI